MNTEAPLDHLESLRFDDEAHSGRSVQHFSSADLEPHHFGKPPPRAFRFGMVEFLRTAFDLPTVQPNSLASLVAIGQIRGEPLGIVGEVGERVYSAIYWYGILVPRAVAVKFDEPRGIRHDLVRLSSIKNLSRL